MSHITPKEKAELLRMMEGRFGIKVSNPASVEIWRTDDRDKLGTPCFKGRRGRNCTPYGPERTGCPHVREQYPCQNQWDEHP